MSSTFRQVGIRPVTVFLLAALPTLLLPGTGQAAYALAQVQVDSFRASVVPGGVVDQVPTYQIDQTATLAPFGTDTATTASVPDLRQVRVGSPVAPENTFSPLGPTGAYARADSRIGLLDPPTSLLTSFDLIAETNRTTPGTGSAGATVEYGFTVDVIPDGIFAFSFFASAAIVADPRPNGTATGGIGFEVALFNGDELLAGFAPEGDPEQSVTVNRGAVSNVSDPFPLNVTRSNGEYSPSRNRYSFSYRVPGDVNSITVSLIARTTANVSVPSPPETHLAVPEPSGAVMIGLGVLGVAGRYRLRRRTAG